jgi:hypothetical protein
MSSQKLYTGRGEYYLLADATAAPANQDQCDDKPRASPPVPACPYWTSHGLAEVLPLTYMDLRTESGRSGWKGLDELP